jgi:hypothetical protein
MNSYWLPICHGHGASVRLVRLLRPDRWGAARPELTPGIEGGAEPEVQLDPRRVSVPTEPGAH